ncbi:MAG: aspartate aminotransferase family protein [Rickettsiales bacterium]|jgi:acetylornithine/N-succinyldiaminopimelate aminotransferase|nr:aspartate aminotransferase family protein [Rickettsiales bacterium]
MLSPLLNVYNRCDISFVKGKGAYLYADNGREYVDFSSGVAVNSLGHNHPALVKTLQDAATFPWHVSNLYKIPGQEQLAQKLVDNTGLDYVYFCNSGAEAVETAIKIVRKYNHDNNTNKTEILTFEHAFHGRTIAAISAAGSEKYQQGYAPLLPGFTVIPSVHHNDIEAVEGYVSEQTSAIMLEPIQGEGGINVFSQKFLQSLSKLCQARNIALILDEVQCGVGRTGKLFHYLWHDIKPDIICSAKGIGGGFPLSACITNLEYGSCMIPGSHGGTYGGNPLAMSVGNCIIDEILSDGFLENVIKGGDFFKASLVELQREFPEIITEVKGLGFLLGLKIKNNYIKLADSLRIEGVLTVPASNDVIRFMPPLIIKEEDIALGIKRCRNALTKFKAEGLND